LIHSRRHKINNLSSSDHLLPVVSHLKLNSFMLQPVHSQSQQLQDNACVVKESMCHHHCRRLLLPLLLLLLPWCGCCWCRLL
jgi:hypothetical protein